MKKFAFNFVIWIDADSCPLLIRNYVADYAQSKNLDLRFVANKNIPVHKKSPKSKNTSFNIKMIVCSSQKDAADDYIFLNAGERDVVITRDLLFAKRLVDKKIFVMNDRGTVFNSFNIEDRLAESRFNMNLREIGFLPQARSRFGKKELAAFSSVFERHISRLIADGFYF